MAFNAKILLDSMHPEGDSRLTTFEITFPRFILAEFNTHRMLSRNAASSRARPTIKLIQEVKHDPYIPNFELNQPGMQSSTPMEEEHADLSRKIWLVGRDRAVEVVENLLLLKGHKQFINRPLEPYMWATVITSATDWTNFFALRCHNDAQPEFRTVARMMYKLYKQSKPTTVDYGDWHLPLIFEEDRKEFSIEDLCKISAGRCARVSYLTHDSRRDPQEDIKLHDKLTSQVPKHSSPLEHQAFPLKLQNGLIHQRCGNFEGWMQYRKRISNENIIDESMIQYVDQN